MNRYIYHYCAQYQITVGNTTFIDGIALMENRITCHDDYRKIKPLIEPEHHEKLTVTSLTFLGMENEST